jgi:DNA mismatch endonuclease (patch repair protein)
MADKITQERRCSNMARIRSVDTTPELTVRSLLHREGLRFSLHRTALPGKPDLVLKKHMAVVFVNGCSWHQHEACPEGRVPRTRRSYWVPKLEATLARDRAVRTALTRDFRIVEFHDPTSRVS